MSAHYPSAPGRRPLVSVIMSVHDGEPYLGGAIDSILGQTLSDLECIVVDDLSADRSAEILRERASLDPRVTVITSRVRLGLTRALNLACARARGRYVARMDADDISLPQRLERQVAFLESHPRIGLVGSFYSEIDEHGVVTVPVYRFPVEPILVEWRMAFENPLPHPPILARRSALEAVGGYDERWSTSQDYDLFTRLTAVTQLANCPEVLFLWRRHGASVSSSRMHAQRDNALAIARAYVARVLGRPVSSELIDVLWRRNPQGLSDARRYVSAALALSHRIAEGDKWSAGERRLLKRAVSRRLVYAMRPFAHLPRAWIPLARIGLLSPSVFWEMGKRRARRLAGGRPMPQRVV